MDGVLGRNNTWIYSPGFAAITAVQWELGVQPCLVEAVLSMDTTMSSTERALSFLHPDIATGALMWDICSSMEHYHGHHNLHQELCQLETSSHQRGNCLCDQTAA